MTIAEQIAEKTAARDRLNEEIAELEGRKRKYPYVGITDDTMLVLFTSELTGVNINGIELPIGTYDEEWVEEDFLRFTGSIRYVDGRPVEIREE
jgi:hypothetical protein